MTLQEPRNCISISDTAVEGAERVVVDANNERSSHCSSY